MNTAVNESDAIAALNRFRRAVHLIRQLQRSAFPRWFDGIPTWFSDERPTEGPAEVIFYDAAEVALYRTARQLLFDAVAINPYLPDAYWLLGNAAAEIDGDKATQLGYYHKALALDPDNEDFLNVRMGHHLNAGDLDAACLDLERLEALNSNYARSMREQYDNAINGG
ncbi:MAG: hypothetical protein H6821_00310 [Planctomycetaceae bacterium]|nr:hypothetical protein [Planctomycetales bacterium]MCB9872592.1 hypothetical protein [Planctomycetaceae bacterium]MCB9939582.1 hypothetical protein [Planctomycetaceae bacterium]HRX80640.1 hypothetical protein [Pirellulaceae bacterium]